MIIFPRSPNIILSLISCVLLCESVRQVTLKNASAAEMRQRVLSQSNPTKTLGTRFTHQ